jgi:hypothetical protein
MAMPGILGVQSTQCQSGAQLRRYYQHPASSIQYPSIQTLRLLRLKLVAEGDAQHSTARGVVKM